MSRDLDKGMRQVYLTEAQNLIKTVPELASRAFEQAQKEEFETKAERLISENAPNLAKFAGAIKLTRESDIRDAVRHIVSQTSEILIDIGEVECPRCGGTGQTGLVGDYCAYCGGSCFVSKEKAETYDPDAIDEVDCPRCGGTGQTGLVGDYCAYCGGSCLVSKEKAKAYAPDAIDEVECPRCRGTGQTGLVGDTCKLCRGRCVVATAVFEAYLERYG